MLLRLQAFAPYRLFAKMQKTPDLKAKFGERAVFFRSQIFPSRHIVSRYDRRVETKFGLR